MRKITFKPAFTCRKITQINPDFVIVRLRNRTYSILKLVKGYWKLGTLKFRSKKDSKLIHINVFKNKPIWSDNCLIINGQQIQLSQFRFNQTVIYIDKYLNRGLIRKDYIKKMPT